MLAADLQKTLSVCFWTQRVNPLLLVKLESMCVGDKSDGIDISAHLPSTQHCLKALVGLYVS